MKRLAAILLFLASTCCLAACDDKGNTPLDSLSETVWEGTLKFFRDQTPETCKIRVLFSSATEGSYLTLDLPESSVYSSSASFTYEYSKKSITIKNASSTNNILRGYWWIDKLTEKEFRLRNDILGEESQMWILTLNRRY